MIPPALLYLNFRPGHRGWWLPFFLLWPLFLLAALLILPVWLLACLVLIWFPAGRAILALPLAFYRMLCSLRGLIVDVQDGAENVSVKLI